MATHKKSRLDINSILLLMLAFATIGEGHRKTKVTITATVTSVVTTITSTKSTYTVCASVSTQSSSTLTACRRRRQYWIDVPVFLALDDRVHDRLSQFFIQPAKVLQVEPTADPMMMWFRTDQSSEFIDNDNVISSQSIEPSWFDFEPQIFGRLTNHLINHRRREKKTKTVVVLSTILTTSTQTATAYTSTNTFFISGCTPLSLPYQYC